MITYRCNSKLKAPQLLADVLIVTCEPPSSGDDFVARLGLLCGDLDRVQRGPLVVVFMLLHLVLELDNRQVANSCLLKYLGDGYIELARLMVGWSTGQIPEVGSSIHWS